MSCAVTITTHNRLPDLQRTLRALDQLRPRPDEVIVCADGCSDGTEEFIRIHYPSVLLMVNREAQGSIAARDAMIRRTQSDLLLSLDDDSYPIEFDFLRGVIASFDRNPKLAVLTFPQRTDEFPETLTTADFGPSLFVGTFSNAGAVIRRSAYLELGGYPTGWWHAYEEPDFALRCGAAGWQVRSETSLTIRHHFTPAQRNEIRTHQFHARNELWSVIVRCPAPQLFSVALFRAARQLRYACQRGAGWAFREPIWWAGCLAGIPCCLEQRKPLSWKSYSAWMKLVRRPIESEQEWLAEFGGQRPGTL